MRTGKYDINTVHETKHNGQLVVIGYVDYEYRRVRFVDTGYITDASISHIGSGYVRDPYALSVFGVACLGEHEDHPLRKTLYKRWEVMLYRVHVVKSGKSISPNWYCFANFMRDALQLPGIELLYTHSKSNLIDLDSDIISNERGVDPVYSKDTCQWVPHAENLRARNVPKQYVKRPIGSVIETKHGPVTIIEKDNKKWLIRFSDGAEKWYWSATVLNNTFGKPDLSEQ